MTTNWTKESEKLCDAGEFGDRNPCFNTEILKIQANNIQAYELKFLNEGNSIETEYNGEKMEKLAVDVEYKQKKYVWFINKSKTKDSLYGQLVSFAINNGNKLEDGVMKLTVAGKDKNRRYQIEVEGASASSTTTNNESVAINPRSLASQDVKPLSLPDTDQFVSDSVVGPMDVNESEIYGMVEKKGRLNEASLSRLTGLSSKVVSGVAGLLVDKGILACDVVDDVMVWFKK